MNVQLPADAAQFVEGLVASGQYQTVEDVVADGVRLLMARQQLRAEIRQGIDELNACQGIEGERVFEELREQARTLIEKSG